MSEVIRFPTTAVPVAVPVEAATVIDARTIIITLEHEIAEARDCIASQSLTITRYRTQHFTRALMKHDQRLSAARLMGLMAVAVMLGWVMNFPLAHALIDKAQAMPVLN